MARLSATRPRDVILVIDDDLNALSMLSDALEANGLTALVARDGENALAILQHISPDLILMDAVMPRLDGFQTCKRIKQQERFASIPVIFMTGLSHTEHVLQGFDAGGVDYITKPIVIAQMIARIRVHLANSRLARGAREALDTASRHLFASDSDDKLLWWTPQAGVFLKAAMQSEPTIGSVIPEEIKKALLASQSQVGKGDNLPGAPNVKITYIGQGVTDERLFRLTPFGAERDEKYLARQLAISLRESEVLLWLSRGKSNKDIASILDMSPRTVDKHLEQIYRKIGVEGRTAAVRIAVELLGGA